MSVMGTSSTARGMADTLKTTDLGPDATWTTKPEILPNKVWPDIDPSVSACSPIDPKVYLSSSFIDPNPPGGWQTLPFFAVWAGQPNQAILQFSRPQTVLQLLWGSLDRTNLIELFLGDTGKTVSGADLPEGLVKVPGQGAALIRISGLKFDRVRFTFEAGAFEMTNITSEAPLPPALLMLAGAFGLLGAAARRRCA
jgi:hypothetical protein